MAKVERGSGVHLIDTSAWIHTMRRKGDAALRERVNQLLRNRQAAWCDMVRLELWSNAGSDRDRSMLEVYQEVVPTLPITAEIWDDSCRLADRCRAAGNTVPVPDLVIAACAWHHGAEILHADARFDTLLKYR